MKMAEQLGELGLSGKKAQVYLAVLQIGAGNVAQIAAEARVKRTTAYDLLDELIGKELVAVSYRGKKRIYRAEDPSHLLRIPARQQQQIETILPDLRALYNLSPNKPRIQYYEGLDGIRTVDRSLLTVEAGEYFYFGAAQDIIGVVGEDYMQEYITERVKRGIWSNAIRVGERETEHDFFQGDDRFLRRVRHFPEPIIGDIVALYVYDQKVAITSTRAECFGLIIESAELSRLLKAIWQMLWHIAVPAAESATGD